MGSSPLAVFEMMTAELEARFGPPSERDVDSNGCGAFDAYELRFECGLEIALSRFHLDRALQHLDVERAPARFEIHANRDDLAHIAFHLGVSVARMSLWTNLDGSLVATPAPEIFVVMRTDDNGIDAAITRTTSRCEADAIARDFEARGHKQLYWVTTT
jgi:hypothetical protein